MDWEMNKSSEGVQEETTEERKWRRICEFWVFIIVRGGKGLPTGPGEGAGVGGEGIGM